MSECIRKKGRAPQLSELFPGPVDLVAAIKTTECALARAAK